MERGLYHGIYSEKLLDLSRHCNERNCDGMLESTGYLRFDRKSPPKHSWAIEYECATCHAIELWRSRDLVPLVRDVLRPIVED